MVGGDVVKFSSEKRLSYHKMRSSFSMPPFSFGLFVLMSVTWVRIELLGFLPDRAAINTMDIITIPIGSFGSASVNLKSFVATVSYEVAVAGLRSTRANFFTISSDKL